ncbi:hypothetical protein E5A73_02175 [Sphingomonas gei]|uniref:PH domain-containing protein n=1 Tax=Sphingomonas gei TaxID=1395960 RepID=A0A4S1XJC2_9SPHN|nr:hypothetical protein [Sphingomonas gei]TGX55943.1 hypothetical protein E5A73_02175 [Sphingomonas gei]
MSPSEHPYHRSLAPMMWVFFGLACIELVVVHFLVALWDWRVALMLSLISLSGVVWLFVVVASFRRLPVVIDDDGVVLRAGRLRSVRVPLGEIAEIRTHWDGEEVKGRDVLNLALIAYPNVLIELRNALPGRRSIRRVAHRFDDPAAFQRALLAAIGASGREVAAE